MQKLFQKFVSIVMAAAVMTSIVPTAVSAQTGTAEAFSLDEAIATPVADEALNPDTEKIEAFVTRLYRNFLLREPEQSGLDAWSNVLIDGSATGATVVKGFVNSKEFQSLNMGNREYIEVFYRIILGREPDEEGVQSWLKVLDQGFSRKKVLEGFVNSQEMKLLCADMGVVAGSYKSNDPFDMNYKVFQFVDRLYHNVLNRDPDPQGREYWTNALINGDINGFTIILGFFTSSEMQSEHMFVNDYLTICYRTILNREPDEAGLQQWGSEYGAYGDLYVLMGMCKSQEFKNLCNQYGIKAFGAAFGTEFGTQFGRRLSELKNDFDRMVPIDDWASEAYTDGRVVIADEYGNGKFNSVAFIDKNEYTIKGVFYGQYHSEALGVIDRMGIVDRDFDEEGKIEYLYLSEHEMYALHQDAHNQLDYVYYFYDPTVSLYE